jgi:hypothetical protein
VHVDDVFEYVCVRMDIDRYRKKHDDGVMCIDVDRVPVLEKNLERISISNLLNPSVIDAHLTRCSLLCDMYEYENRDVISRDDDHIRYGDKNTYDRFVPNILRSGKRRWNAVIPTYDGKTIVFDSNHTTIMNTRRKRDQMENHDCASDIEYIREMSRYVGQKIDVFDDAMYDTPKTMRHRELSSNIRKRGDKMIARRKRDTRDSKPKKYKMWSARQETDDRESESHRNHVRI